MWRSLFAIGKDIIQGFPPGVLPASVIGNLGFGHVRCLINTFIVGSLDSVGRVVVCLWNKGTTI
jgi:hypothetical protein